MPAIRLGLALALCLACGSAAAQVFRWVDADGKVHYGDRPPAEAKASELRIHSIPREEPARDIEVLPAELEWFVVQGATLDKLRSAMRQNAPRDLEGTPRWGMAYWRLRWKFAHDASRGCRIDKLAITVTSRLIMPRWVDRASAPAALQGMWDRFYAALLLHENGHRDNGIRAGNDLARRLRGMNPQRDCAALNAEIEEIGRRVIVEYRLVDKAYDRTTNHGQEQGAVFR